MIALEVEPVAKPRITRRDKWAERPSVMRYRAFKDELLLALRAAGITDVAPRGVLRVRFTLPMPRSWPAKRRAFMTGAPHTSRPDVDNLVKALMDATLRDDSHIWMLGAEKVWGERGRIELLDSDPW